MVHLSDLIITDSIVCMFKQHFLFEHANSSPARNIGGLNGNSDWHEYRTSLHTSQAANVPVRHRRRMHSFILKLYSLPSLFITRLSCILYLHIHLHSLVPLLLILVRHLHRHSHLR
jgi:hypothetical protein